MIIPDSVTSIGSYAFSGCTSLTNMTIPDSVTSIESYVFYECTSLTNVIIPDSVTSIGSYVFYGCTSLTSIVIPDSVTSIGSSVFYGCTSLTSVTIPDSVTSIGSYAFYRCTSLINITIGRDVTSTLDDIFDSYNKLERIDVSEENTKYSSIQGILFNKEKSTIIKYPSNKNDISNYEIPSTVEIIEKYAFQNCTSLTSVTIPDSVTNISGSAFIGCNKLERINVSENNDTYSSVDGILYNKEKTEMLIVPEGNKSIGRIETPHSYYNNMSETYSKIIEGASSLSLVFDSKCELESSYDYIEIYNKTDTLVYTSKGKGNKALANKEITVEGDTVKIHFYTDSSNVYWGFKCLVKASNTK